MESIMRKITVAILIAASLLVSACNTVRGVGRDIESVGNAGDRAI
jgi:predicted small secreted protein